MTPVLEPMSLIAAFAVGLAGSAHCFGMCGGIAGALKLRTQAIHRDRLNVAVDSIYHHAGRIAMYASLGAVAGAFGGTLNSIFYFSAFGVVLRVASGVLLLMIAARLLIQWNGLAVLERLGTRLWRLTQPITKRVSPGGHLSSLLIGACWGLVPCAMVYSSLAFAGFSGSPISGALLMTAFGLGTLPGVLGGTLVFSGSTKMANADLARRLSGALLVLFGLWMIVAPLAAHYVHSAHPAHVH
jgi:sulfite exporter TauE/SafE